MGWFGGLELAYKYALVFGSALFATLLLGFLKLLADRRKMKKLMKDLEQQPGRKKTIDLGHLELNMREKDEGDLFGIRAIEAGFFGGIAQSAPTSVAGSPTGSRCASPVPGFQSPQGHSASSSVTVTGSRPLTPSNLGHTKKLSNSSSLLSSARTSGDSNVSDLVPPSFPGHFRSASHNSGIEGRRPMGGQPTLGHTYSPKLLPSQAELSGRINHTPIGMTFDAPPSIVLAHHPSRTSPEHEYASSPSNVYDPSRKSPRSSTDRNSGDSSDSSKFEYLSDRLNTSTLPEPPTLSMPAHIGTSPFAEAVCIENPHSDRKSKRVSFLDQASMSDGSLPLRANPPAAKLPNLPAFPKSAIINSTNPRFQGFVQERGPKAESFSYKLGDSSSDGELDQILAENRRGNFDAQDTPRPPPSPTNQSYEMGQSTNMPTTTISGNRLSRRTSFSFSMTNPDAYDPEIAAFNAQSRLGEAPMSSMNPAKYTKNQNQGTYQPKGAPNSNRF